MFRVHFHFPFNSSLKVFVHLRKRHKHQNICFNKWKVRQWKGKFFFEIATGMLSAKLQQVSLEVSINSWKGKMNFSEIFEKTESQFQLKNYINFFLLFFFFFISAIFFLFVWITKSKISNFHLILFVLSKSFTLK